METRLALLCCLMAPLGCGSSNGGDGTDEAGESGDGTQTGAEDGAGDGAEAGAEDGAEDGAEAGAEDGGMDGGEVEDMLDDDFAACERFQAPDCDGVECGEDETARDALEILLAAPMFAQATRDIWVTHARDSMKYVDIMEDVRVLYVEYVGDAGWAAGRGQLYYEYEGELDWADFTQWAGEIEPFIGIELASRDDVEAGYAACDDQGWGLTLDPCGDGILIEGAGEGGGVPWELLFLQNFSFGDGSCTDFGQVRVDGSSAVQLECSWATECG